MATRPVVRGIILAASLLASRTCAADKGVDYLQKIKPLLAASCYAYHGALNQKAGLRLDTAAVVLKGRDRGPAIELGNPDASHFLGGNGWTSITANQSPKSSRRHAAISTGPQFNQSA